MHVPATPNVGCPRHRRFGTLCVLGALLVSAAATGDGIGSGYELTQFAVHGGGGTLRDEEHFELDATVGQPATTGACGSTLCMTGGFWTERFLGTIALSPGWNLVSVAVDPSDSDSSDARAAFAAVGVVGQLYRWDGTAYVAAYELVPKTGCWAYRWAPARRSMDVCEIEVPGRQIADALAQLSVGWNLVGPVGECPVPQSRGTVGAAWRWDGELCAYERLASGEMMKPGNGYWIYATASCEVALGSE